MRSTRRVAAACSVALLSSVAVGCVAPTSSTSSTTTTTTTVPSAATTAQAKAAAWLLTQFDSSSTIPSAYVAGADLSATAYAATSLKLANTGAATRTAAVTALAGQVDALVVDSSGADRPGALARLILAAIADGRNPRSFGGYDLVARLEATVQSSGRFGVQSGLYDGAFRQGLSLAALSLVTPTPASLTPTGGASIDTVPTVAWLRAQQCADGSWMYRANPATACGFDPVTFVDSDSNGTAMAILGLKAVGASFAVNPTTWLTSIRQSDGGWGYDASSTNSDPDSTGLVMAALRSLGTPADAAATTALVTYQFGSSAAAADQGAFFYPPFSGPATPNVLSTNDAILGLDDQVWPQSLAS